MITTKELYDWRGKILTAKEEAEEKLGNYDDKSFSLAMSAYYEYVVNISTVQLALIERLIRQSDENEKEQICQK